ncbi:hypothetical protein KAR91_40255, partial [Candidatus Pacearchaeota archaeon]|nr:hypothetical protein [Candidatus Pacearchaeota archaeon]
MTLFMIGGVPDPVFPGPGSAYDEKVWSYSPIAYYPFDDASGDLRDIMGGASAVANGNPGYQYASFPNGDDVGRLANNNTTFFEAPAAALAAFNPDEGSLLMWFQAEVVPVWGTTPPVRHLTYATDNTDELIFRSANDTLTFERDDPGTQDQVGVNVSATTNWMCFLCTWSITTPSVELYYNGVSQGPDVSGIGAFTGNPVSLRLGSDGST